MNYYHHEPTDEGYKYINVVTGNTIEVLHDVANNWYIKHNGSTKKFRNAKQLVLIMTYLTRKS